MVITFSFLFSFLVVLYRHDWWYIKEPPAGGLLRFGSGPKTDYYKLIARNLTIDVFFRKPKEPQGNVANLPTHYIK
jgi:hypothetical protein